MKVSIITVCYNEKKDIETTCESAITQNFDDFEWIVVDGDSDDGTVEILEKYRDHMAFFVSQKDHGVYDAMNSGLAQARGEYVLFLNGGDAFFDKHVLQNVFGQNMFKADILYGGCLGLKKNGSQKKIHYPKNIKKYFFYNDNFNHQSVFIRRSLFEEHGGYSEKYKIAADFEKWLCFMENNATFERIPFFVSCFKLFDGLSTNKNTEQYAWSERQDIIKHYFPERRSLWFHVKNVCYVLGTMRLGTMVNFIINRPVREPLRKVWKAITYKK